MSAYDCVRCGTTYVTDVAVVAGVPTAQWFRDRGSLCSPCLLQRQRAATVTEQAPNVVKPGVRMQQVVYRDGSSYAERARAFHDANPWVLTALEDLTYDLVARGARKVGIRMLWEIVRWQYQRATVDRTSTFKANDHYHAHFVRFLLEQHPEWTELFELRQLRAA